MRKPAARPDRQDQSGRLRLLERNVQVMHDVVPPIVAEAPSAVILVATYPPESLTDVVRDLAPGVNVFGTGTCLDSLRFRVHLADALGMSLDPFKLTSWANTAKAKRSIGRAQPSATCPGMTLSRSVD